MFVTICRWFACSDIGLLEQNIRKTLENFRDLRLEVRHLRPSDFGRHRTFRSGVLGHRRGSMSAGTSLPEQSGRHGSCREYHCELDALEDKLGKLRLGFS
jgi:hypothetical protein